MPLAAATRAFRAESSVGNAGFEGKEASGRGGLRVVWRVVVAGDARIMAALVSAAVGAAPGPRVERLRGG